MQTYGLKRRDRIKCGARIGKKRKRTCKCGDQSSKHPKSLQKDYNMSKRLKHSARQEGKREAVK